MVEGIKTAKAAVNLAKKYEVDAPICQQVYEITHENKPVKEAVGAVLSRAPRGELD